MTNPQGVDYNAWCVEYPVDGGVHLSLFVFFVYNNSSASELMNLQCYPWLVDLRQELVSWLILIQKMSLLCSSLILMMSHDMKIKK